MTARRALVLAVLGVCALLVSAVPLHGLGAALVLMLALLDVLLLAATDGLAFAASASLDERQAALRDLAYRRGFRLLGLAIVLAVIASFLGTYVAAVRSDGGALSQVDSGFSGRVLVAIGELVVILPTLVVAWTDRSRGGAPRGLAVLSVPALAAAWFAAVAWMPAQAVGVSRNFDVSASATGSTCGHFVGGRMVGGGFGATVGMRAHVCWNGRMAFVIGDPAIPLPAGVMADPYDRSLTACGADNVDDFAAVSRTSCAATIDSTGTLHYTVRAHVAPWSLPIGGRDVVMQLVVTRQGRVLSRP